MKQPKEPEDPLISLLAAALRNRGDLPPQDDGEALERWLEKFALESSKNGKRSSATQEVTGQALDTRSGDTSSQ